MDFDFQKARNSLHQLNNKIAQILAYAELLQLSLKDEKEKERIKLVISGALESRQITASLMGDMPKVDSSWHS
jgi:light-regulated signal transduction histidine kinase (bacteriophytochrome)